MFLKIFFFFLSLSLYIITKLQFRRALYIQSTRSCIRWPVNPIYTVYMYMYLYLITQESFINSEQWTAVVPNDIRILDIEWRVVESNDLWILYIQCKCSCIWWLVNPLYTVYMKLYLMTCKSLIQCKSSCILRPVNPLYTV